MEGEEKKKGFSPPPLFCSTMFLLLLSRLPPSFPAPLSPLDHPIRKKATIYDGRQIVTPQKKCSTEEDNNNNKKTAQNFKTPLSWVFFPPKKSRLFFRFFFHAAAASAPPPSAQERTAASIVPKTSSTFPAPSTLTITPS